MIIGEVVPHLFVGLGGAGGKVIGRIATLLKHKWDYTERYANLTRFAVIDTDSSAVASLKRGDSGKGAVDKTVLISDFDKQAFASLVRGSDFSTSDPFYTQWIYDDYRFRAGDTAGAGQIRLESRLGLMHALVKGNVYHEFARLMDQLRHHLNAAANPDAALHAHVAFSVAGGTGAGTFLPFAYFLKNLAKREGVPLKIIGYAMQPHIVEDVVGANFEDTCANAYASLKELEFLSQLSVQRRDTEAEGVRFHYDVQARIGESPRVKERPFEMVYVIDAPSAFYHPRPEEALADCIYVQLFSPFGAAQASDVDNYAKHQRQLLPQSLHEETGRGYTAFYGSMGMCVLHVPNQDILRYCALRFASDAIKTYLLLEDPDLVPDAKRAEFNRYVISESERKQLSEEARKRKLDESFARKVDVIVEGFADREETFWGGLLRAARNVRAAFEQQFETTVGSVARNLESSISALSPHAITDYSWMPDGALSELEREVLLALERAEAECQHVEENLRYSWWPEFLAAAGPGGAKLNPYEQRYCLLVLLGYCPRVLSASEAPLGATALEEAARGRRAADALLAAAVGDEFRADLDSSVAGLRETAPRSFWDQFRMQALEEQRLEATEAVVRKFGNRVAQIRAALRRSVRGRFLEVLNLASDALLDKFREIDQKGGLEAAELRRCAAEHMRTGRLCYKKPDGRMVEPLSEAEQYSVDEEALMAPNGLRLWDRYYDDQVRPILGDDDQLEGIQLAFTETLKPKHDTAGRIVARSGERLVREIADALFEEAQQALHRRIVGTDGSGGLTLDDAIALESVYVRSMDTSYRQEAERLLHACRNGRTSIDIEHLWADPDQRQATQVYTRQKLSRVLDVKAGLLCAVDRDKLTTDIKFSEKLVVGAHERYRDTQRTFGALLSAVVGNAFVPVEDPQRVFVYRYLYGVPVYAFPKVVGELQTAYRKHQSRRRKAWFLHIDRNFENLPDLDPNDIKQELSMRLVPLFEAGLLTLRAEGGDVELKDGDRLREIAPTIEAAADRIAQWRDQDDLTRPALYDKLLAEPLNAALRLFARPTLDAFTRLDAYCKRLGEDEVRAADDPNTDHRYVRALRQLRALAQQAARKVTPRPITD